MPALLIELFGSPWTYLFVVGLLWVGKIAVERLATRTIDRRFDERLESHRHSLQLITEQARFDYQRDLANHNLLISRRHAAAEAVFSKARIAHGAVSNLFGVREVPTFEEFSLRDIEELMLEYGVVEGKRTELLDLLEEDRGTGVAAVNSYLRLLEVHEADKKLNEARNEAYFNELYLTDEASDALDDLFSVLWDWVYQAKNFHDGVERKFTRQHLSNAVTHVKNILRSELEEGTWRRGRDSEVIATD